MRVTFRLTDYWPDTDIPAHLVETLESIGCIVPDAGAYSWAEYSAEINDLLRSGLSFTVEGNQKSDLSVANQLFDQFQLLEAKITTAIAGLDSDHHFNQKCNVHISGIGLLAITEVSIYYDLCTDTLQSLLSEGWRIVAVCPQPNQRRPDYILGRSPSNT